jgi:hypothetical protein
LVDGLLSNPDVAIFVAFAAYTMYKKRSLVPLLAIPPMVLAKINDGLGGGGTLLARIAKPVSFAIVAYPWIKKG